MWRLKAALAAVVFLSATCGSAAWAQSGLLLGLGRPCLEGLCETVYRTLWIAPHGGRVQIVELPDLIVPRRASGGWERYLHPNQAPVRLDSLVRRSRDIEAPERDVARADYFLERGLLGPALPQRVTTVSSHR
jgi:hypothetical protein